VVRFRVQRADEIAAKHGLVLVQDKAIFFGCTPSTYSRVCSGSIAPGERFIADVLSSQPGDPDITFDNLFELAQRDEVAS
jgi:hypothetical protein